MTALNRRTILITGAAGGFGQSMTKQFLAAGARLILHDRDREALRARTAKTAAEYGVADRLDRVVAYLASDLATPEGAQSLYDQAQAPGQEVDILVNNAGIAMSGAFLSVPRERWETLMQVNLLAVMRLTGLFAPAMVARHSGHIVNISSVAGIVGAVGLTPYSAAKFGVRGFTEALAGELKPQGVMVTGVYPFFARTPLLVESPHYGGERRELPQSATMEPDKVMAAAIRGIQRNATHIYPDIAAWTINVIRHVLPWAIPPITKAMSAE